MRRWLISAFMVYWRCGLATLLCFGVQDFLRPCLIAFSILTPGVWFYLYTHPTVAITPFPLLTWAGNSAQGALSRTGKVPGGHPEPLSMTHSEAALNTTLEPTLDSTLDSTPEPAPEHQSEDIAELLKFLATPKLPVVETPLDTPRDRTLDTPHSDTQDTTHSTTLESTLGSAPVPAPEPTLETAPAATQRNPLEPRHTAQETAPVAAPMSTQPRTQVATQLPTQVAALPGTLDTASAARPPLSLTEAVTAVFDKMGASLGQSDTPLPEPDTCEPMDDTTNTTAPSVDTEPTTGRESCADTEPTVADDTDLPEAAEADEDLATYGIAAPAVDDEEEEDQAPVAGYRRRPQPGIVIPLPGVYAYTEKQVRAVLDADLDAHYTLMPPPGSAPYLHYVCDAHPEIVPMPSGDTFKLPTVYARRSAKTLGIPVSSEHSVPVSRTAPTNYQTATIKALDARELPTNKEHMHGSPGTCLSSLEDAATAKIGLLGEQRLAKMFDRFGVLDTWESYWSVHMFTAAGKRDTDFQTDIDCVLVAGNVVLLVDAKNYRAAGYFNYSQVQAVEASKNEGQWSVNGDMRRPLELKRNMLMAYTRVVEICPPNAIVIPCVAFTPNTFGHPHVKSLRFPGCIQAIAALDLSTKLAALAPEYVPPVPSIHELFAAHTAATG